MRIVRSSNFWIGVGVGAIIAPMVLKRFAPGIAAKLPS